MATVIHLFRAPKRRQPMEESLEALAVENMGLEGCAHARPQAKRQVLLMDQRCFRLGPGDCAGERDD